MVMYILKVTRLRDRGFGQLGYHGYERIQSTPDNSNLQGKSRKGFELSGARVSGSSKKIAESKVKNGFYCTGRNILITFNCRNIK